MPDNPNIEKIPDVIEQAPIPEQSADTGQPIEQAPEQISAVEQEATPVEVNLSDDTNQTTPQASNAQIVLQKVENILSQDMDKAFLSMDVATQHQFKVKGEQTGRQITVLLQKGKVTVQKIISLILEWLRIIPQVNRHYIEQEAKIKAENIISMYQDK
jgi:hypothetical protein